MLYPSGKRVKTGVCARCTSDSWRIRRMRRCCVYAWKRNELSWVLKRPCDMENEKKDKERKTKRHALDSVESSLTLPSRHASAKKKDIRRAKGGLWCLGSDLMRWRFWKGRGLWISKGRSESNTQDTPLPKRTYAFWNRFLCRPWLRHSISIFFCHELGGHCPLEELSAPKGQLSCLREKITPDLASETLQHIDWKLQVAI